MTTISELSSPPRSLLTLFLWVKIMRKKYLISKTPKTVSSFLFSLIDSWWSEPLFFQCKIVIFCPPRPKSDRCASFEPPNVEPPRRGLFSFYCFFTSLQVWARSPEGDKSPTKIGSSRVGIGIGEGLPDFLTNRDRDRGGLPDFLKFRGNSG